MSYGRNAFIGGAEATDLIGRWQQIVGADPWQQIVGAETQFHPYGNPYANPYARPPHNPHAQAQWWQQQRTRRRHQRHPHHQHLNYPVPPHVPYGPYGHGCQVPGYQVPVPPVSVRDHRRAFLQNQAYVRGDSVALGALALMGAEDQAAAETGIPPVDATIPADPGAHPIEGPPAAMAPPPMPMPIAPPIEMMPPPEMPPPMEQAHHHHRRHWRQHRRDRDQYGPPPGYGYEVAPRNALVDYPGPSRADRVVLPMSSGVNILPNTSAQITSRPQTVAFRPERLIIGGNAGDWIINDVKVGNRSQFSQSGDVPGEMFAATTIDSFVSFETVQTAMDFVVLVTFVGASESGAPFVCGVLGTAAI